jgi:hypothetical protein
MGLFHRSLISYFNEAFMISPSPEGGAMKSIRPDRRKLSRKLSCNERPLNGGRFVHDSVSWRRGDGKALTSASRQRAPAGGATGFEFRKLVPE